MNKNRLKQRNGFTLVEVAIVIVFMGIFITFASSMLKGIALSTKYRSARDKLTTTSDAVQAWAVKNRAIPTSFTSFTSATGVTRDYWNKPYTFYPYTASAGAPRDVCRWSRTNLAVCPGGNCASKVIKDVAYVLVSGGDNLLLQTSPTISGCPSGLKCMPLNELSTSFDDLYMYVTLLELKKTVGCVEANSGLRIMNGELPTAQKGSHYDISIWADGGQPQNNDYIWTWSSSSSTLLLPDTAIFTSSYKPPDGGTTRFRIYSTPTAGTFPQTYPLTLTVKDSTGATATKSFVLTVK